MDRGSIGLDRCACGGGGGRGGGRITWHPVSISPEWVGGGDVNVRSGGGGDVNVGFVVGILR